MYVLFFWDLGEKDFLHTLRNNAVLALRIQFPALDPFEEWKVMLWSWRKGRGGLLPISTSSVALYLPKCLRKAPLPLLDSIINKRPC